MHSKHTWEGRMSLSVECTPPTLVSMHSSPSPLSAKLCPMRVHRSVQELEFYCIVSSLAEAHIIHYRHIWEGRSRLSVEWTPRSLVSMSSYASPLSAKLCSMCVHRSVEELEFYCIVSRLMPISYAGSILSRAVGLCPSNAHPQLWCLWAPLHHLCLLSFVPRVSIDPFKS